MDEKHHELQQGAYAEDGMASIGILAGMSLSIPAGATYNANATGTIVSVYQRSSSFHAPEIVYLHDIESANTGSIEWWLQPFHRLSRDDHGRTNTKDYGRLASRSQSGRAVTQ
jgi:hypothetical protein